MTTSAIGNGLRVAAILIAVAAAFDPLYSVERAVPSPIALIDMTSGSIDRVHGAVVDRAGAPVEMRIPGARIPCAPHERCVIVADGTVFAELPDDVEQPVLIVDDEPQSPNVRLLSATIAAPHVLAAGSARIEMEGQGVSGRATTVRIRAGETVLGSLPHKWESDGTVSVDVPWWPMAPGPQLVRIEAVVDGEETTSSDNAIDVAVSTASARLPVLVFDTRPSWNSTFIRRALEDDARFLVEHRARVAPALATATPAGRLDAPTLDRAHVLIVGAPNGLAEDEVALIDRFVRVRGGTAILLPERAPEGAAARLFRTQWTEQLVADAQPVGSLRATEILRSQNVPLGATVLGSFGDRAAIVSMPSGEGAVFVSGAMDAWRFRASDDGAFDRFWRSVVAQSATASAALKIAFDDGLAVPGTRKSFRARRRSMQMPSAIEASAIARCNTGGDDTPASNVRVWPAGSPGAFAGEIAIDRARSCELEVAIGDERVTTGIAIATAPSAPTLQAVNAIEQRVRARGGMVARAHDLAQITLTDTAPLRERVSVHPMRSAWWILPFALCLSGEWWLRRRAGLR